MFGKYTLWYMYSPYLYGEFTLLAFTVDTILRIIFDII